MTKIYHVTCGVIALIISLTCIQAQDLDIHELPQDVTLVPFQLSDLDASYDNIHTYNESIRDPFEATDRSPTGLTFSSTNRIVGAWGNGYYQRVVAFRSYGDYLANPSDLLYYQTPPSNTDLTGVVDSDGEQITPEQLLASWNNMYTQWHDSSLSYVPMIRDVGRRVMGYSRELIDYTNILDPEDLTKYSAIENGVLYLISEYNSDNDKTFLWRLKEDSQKSFDTYVHFNGILGLTEAYWLFKKHDFPASISESTLINTINEAAYSYVLYNKKYYKPNSGETWYNILLDENKATNHKENINYRCQAMWALSEAYKITGNEDLRSLAISIFQKMKNSQRLDGSWETPDSNPYHDARINYHGIIMGGLSSLYSVVKSDPQLENELAILLVKSINHLIDYNGLVTEGRIGRHDEDNTPNGRLKTYHNQDPKNDTNENDLSVAALMGLLMTKYYVVADHQNITGKDHLDALISRIVAMAYPGKYESVWKRQYVKGNKYVRETDFATLVYGLIHDTETNGIYEPTIVSEAREEVAIFNGHPGGTVDRLLFFESGSSTEYESEKKNYGHDFKYMTSGNFDGDGLDDLAVITYNPIDQRNTQLRVYYANGDSAINNLPDGNEFIGIEAGDMQGDGLDDILLINKEAGSNNLRLRIVEGADLTNDKLFFRDTKIQYSSNMQVAFGDFNGNGSDEIAVFDLAATDIQAHVFEWLYEPSNLSLSDAVISLKSAGFPLENGFNYTDIAAGDFDNDGVDEIALYTSKPATSAPFGKRLYMFEVSKTGLDHIVTLNERDLNSRSRPYTRIAAGNFYTDNPGEELAFISSDDQNNDRMTKIYYYSVPNNVATRLGASSSLAGYDYMDLTGGNFKFSEAQSRVAPSVFEQENAEEDLQSLRLYPNPTKHVIFIRLENESQVNSLLVTDISGKVFVPKYAIEGNQIKADLSSLEDGLYFIQLETDHTVKSWKVIKN